MLSNTVDHCPSKAKTSQKVKKNSPYSLEPQGLFLYLQEPVTYSYHEPDESTIKLVSVWQFGVSVWQFGIVCLSSMCMMLQEIMNEWLM
jgi:hypothetical protein